MFCFMRFDHEKEQQALRILAWEDIDCSATAHRRDNIDPKLASGSSVMRLLCEAGAYGPAAIGNNGLAGDVFPGAACQHHRNAADVIGLADPA